MFISKVNFNQLQAKNVNYQQKGFVSFKGLNSNILKNVVESRVVKEKGADIVKTALMSLTAFAALNGISLYKIKDAAKNGELDMQGKKVDAEGANTKEYLQRQETYKQLLVTRTSFIQENGISSEEFEQAVANGEIDVVGKKVNPEGEKTKAFLQNLQSQRQLYRQTHMPKTAFGQLIGVSIHSVEWHINKGNINQKEDGTIDVTDPKNRFFLENFQKGATKKTYEYTPENYEKLQKKLGQIKVEFCLDRGLLVAEEDGSINIENPVNKEFLEKVEKKEIQNADFYMSRQDFARMVHQSDITLKKAINNDELFVDSRKGIDISHPKNKAYIEKALANQVGPGKRRVVRPEGYVSRKAVANMLGIGVASLSHHVQKGRLIEDENGIDLNNPINKYFIDNYEKGAPKDMPEGYEAVEVELVSNRIKKPNHVGKYKLAERLGMSTATLEHHIQAGHIIYTKDGIDLTHPQNVHFMNNYRRGEEYLMPGQEKKVKSDNQEPVEKNKKIKTNFNAVLIGELSKMVKVCVSALGFHFERGRLEKTEDKKIDLSNSKNKEFIAKYEDSVKEAYANMSDEELDESVKDLKVLLKNRMGENIYTVSANMLDDLGGYLEYSLSKIVDTSDLSKDQEALLVSMMEEIVLEELASERVSRAKFFESTEKLELLLYKNLLDEILKRQQALNAVSVVNDAEASKASEVAAVEGNTKAVEANVVDDNEVVEILGEGEEGSIKITRKLNKILADTEQLYSREISAYKIVAAQDINVLTDTYVQYKFSSVANSYFLLKDFNDRMLKQGMPFETEDMQIKYIVERILSKVGTPIFELSENYKGWKKDYMPKNAKVVVSDVIDKYNKALMTKICTEEALMELQKANPAMELEMQDLEDIVCEKFDL